MRYSSFLFFFGLLAACSSADDSKQGGSALTDCTPNQTFACTCGLDIGTQSCTANRTLTACDCSAGSSPSPAPGGAKPAAATCGNGTLDEGEACDDGNKVSGDGCSARCVPDGVPAEASACPGQAVTLWPGETTLAGTTSSFTNKFTASCSGGDGKDRRYLLQPTTDGTLAIEGSFAPGFDAVVEIREDVCMNGNSLLCEDTFSAPFSRAISVVAQHSYFLLVDGVSATDEGAFVLKLTLQ